MLNSCVFRGKMKVDDLRSKVKTSLTNQQIPLMVNATCGTTILGAYDPVGEIADICDEFDMWLHVDVYINLIYVLVILYWCLTSL